MDLDLGAQLDEAQQNPVARLFRELLQTYNNAGIGWFWLKPLLMLRRRRLAREVDEAIKSAIRQKFVELKESSKDNSSAALAESGRSVLALSLRDVDELTPDVLQQTSDQIKSFLFAGHDTTSIALQWCFYELSRTPRVLAALRAELDKVFGPGTDPNTVAEALTARGEEVIGKMQYTSAIIKEVLRLYPAAGTARMAPPGSGFLAKLPGGSEVCLDGMVLYICHYAIQRDPAVYGETKDDFCPERWLGNVDTSERSNGGIATDSKSEGEKAASTEGDSCLPPSSWRPFERGPRNCIGQELANLEARVILTCAVRRYEFIKVGLGEVVMQDGCPVEDAKGHYKVKEELFNVSRSRKLDVRVMLIDHRQDKSPRSPSIQCLCGFSSVDETTSCNGRFQSGGAFWILAF